MVIIIMRQFIIVLVMLIVVLYIEYLQVNRIDETATGYHSSQRPKHTSTNIFRNECMWNLNYLFEIIHWAFWRLCGVIFKVGPKLRSVLVPFRFENQVARFVVVPYQQPLVAPQAGDHLWPAFQASLSGAISKENSNLSTRFPIWASSPPNSSGWSKARML